MNVLFVASESAPFAKVGGMGDVVSSLPAALRHKGIDARVLMPAYGSISWEKYGIETLFTCEMQHRTGTATITVGYVEYDGIPFYFARAWPYIGDGNYIYTDVDWDIRRFVYFSQMTMTVAWELGERLDWFPDVFHVHDWHTALVPFLVHEASADNERWARAATMISIHNLGYQGWEAGPTLDDFGVPPRTQADLVYQDKADNLLAIGLAYSHDVTVVSPRYAEEIQYPTFGSGLEGITRLRAHEGNLYGILNGIDVRLFDPATDPHLVKNFDAKTVNVRIENKRALQLEAGLAVRDDVPLVAVLSRLVWAKGIDLAVPALRHLLASEDMQLVILGTGEEGLEDDLRLLGHHFHWKARAYLEFDAGRAQRIYGGSDLFLMPSRYEPCGLGQMIAMRYGSLPVVRETGGLADTVENYDDGPADEGTGFTFLWESADAIIGTLRWAMRTYRYHKDAWQRMQQRAMQQDFSWARSANEYIQRYERALHTRRPV